MCSKLSSHLLRFTFIYTIVIFYFVRDTYLRLSIQLSLFLIYQISFELQFAVVMLNLEASKDFDREFSDSFLMGKRKKG